MKNEQERLIKRQSLFKPIDLLVYSLTLLMILSLLLFFVILPSTKKTQGFSIFIDGKQVATYLYKGELSIKDDNYKDLIILNNDTLTIYTDGEKNHFNKLQFDNKKNTVKVVDANCSTSKDCVYTPSIKGSSAIVCVPHKLKIVAIGEKTATPPVTGGVR